MFSFGLDKEWHRLVCVAPCSSELVRSEWSPCACFFWCTRASYLDESKDITHSHLPTNRDFTISPRFFCSPSSTAERCRRAVQARVSHVCVCALCTYLCFVSGRPLNHHFYLFKPDKTTNFFKSFKNTCPPYNVHNILIISSDSYTPWAENIVLQNGWQNRDPWL